MLEVETILSQNQVPYRLFELSGKAISHQDVKKYALMLTLTMIANH